MLCKLRLKNASYKTWHKLILCRSSFLTPTNGGQRNQTPNKVKEKIAEPANKQQCLMLRHYPVRLGGNEKLQETRHEKQFENQVNWMKKNNILLHFKCASMKSSTYRQNLTMFPYIIKNPKMISLKGLLQYPMMSLGKIS